MDNPVWCMPIGTAGTCRPNSLLIDANGHSQHPRIVNKVTGNLARGDLTGISGIIVHQTGAASEQSTLSSYNAKNANGAHFLIAKDGTIYQTASVYKMTWHVGKLRSKCLAEGKCDPVNPKARDAKAELAYVSKLKISERAAYEAAKETSARYPMNSDSLGIELVGETVGSDPAHRGELLYAAVTNDQNISLTWLVAQLATQFGVDFNRVLRHPMVSYKTPSEAATADWQYKK